MEQSGKAVPEACREQGIAENTYYRWRRKYGGASVPKRVKPARWGSRAVLARKRGPQSGRLRMQRISLYRKSQVASPTVSGFHA